MAARTRRWTGLALGLAALGSLLRVETAQAHAEYVRSEPGAGAVVAAAPAQVEIWFSQELFRRQGENGITVTGPSGQAVHAGEAVIDDDDRRHMTVSLQPDLAPGEYTVSWHTLSAEDADDDAGIFTFLFDPEAQVTSTPMRAATATPPPATSTPPAPAPSPTPAPEGISVCGVALAPAAGLAAAVFMRVQWRRRR